MSTPRIVDLYPLTPLQRGMLFHTLYANEPGMYFNQKLFALQGVLDVAAFERSWRRALERHDILRTAFVWDEVNEPLQVVLGEVELPLAVLDWRAVPGDAQRRQLQDLLVQDRRCSFDLAQAPLMRLLLIHTGEETQYLLWSHHHLLLDGWSVSLLIREVLALYRAAAQGREAQLPRCRQFRELVAWLERRDPASSERYWRQALAGMKAPPPFAGNGAPAQAGGPDWERLETGGSTSDSVHAFVRRHGLTVNTFVQGVWGLLLSRYSGEEDVVFGATVAGRPTDLPGVESMIGLFINTVPVRIRLTDTETAVSLLARLQQEQSEARQYEHAPLVDIQGWSEVPRGRPLFDTLLVFESFPTRLEDAEQGSAAAQLGIREALSVERTNYPLTLLVRPRPLTLRLDYDRGHFERVAIARLLGHFAALVEAILTGAGAPVGGLSLLTAGERQQLLYEWNETAREWPATERCLHEWIGDRAGRSPDALAFFDGELSLTYRELDRRANGLAHFLRAAGVGAGRVVGILLDRSPEMIVALLGVLKAGGAYLPLDPDYPAARLEGLLQDAGPALLLTAGDLVDRLSDPGCRVVRLDVEPGSSLPLAERAPESGVQADNAAYVIYTSGSTGRPKGVVVTHRAICNRLLWMQEAYGLGPSDRVLQKTPFSFDVSVWELFWPLLTGSCLVMAPPGVHRDPAGLARLIAEQRITTVHFVPSMLRVFLAEREAAACRALRRVIVSGEALPADLVPRFHELLPAELHNLYGPTEAAVDVTAAPCPPGAAVTIGRPIANVRIDLLDRRGEPVPVGVAGELWIGGVALAQGYLGRPDLTAEKFAPDPYGGPPGARRYRTGDLARHLGDGTIDFLGRIDHQVKVRGVRVEPAEVEVALSEDPRVAECVVMSREDLGGDPRIVAYVVPAEGERPEARELRALVSERLPEAMVPSAFVLLEALPRTVSGKVDRRELPAPDWGGGSRQSLWRAPQGLLEEVIAGIWETVLRTAPVGADDHFFELGGHSLLAMQVASRIREALGIDLPLRALFDAPRVSELALRVAAALGRGEGVSPPPLERVPRDGELPLSFAQQRLWLLHQLEPESPAYNIPIALRVGGRLDPALLARSLRAVVERHEALRTVFPAVAGRPSQRLRPVEEMAELPVIDLQALPARDREAELRRHAVREMGEPFDLSRGPLLRVRLLRLGAEEHALLVSMDHIVSDAWSLGVLVREVSALYEAFSRQRPSPLPELPIQYADFAAWQRGWLQGEVIAAELAYWRQRLAGAPELELPTDRPRPVVPSGRGASRPVRLPAALAPAVRELARRKGATPFMVLRSAFAVLLGRWSGRDDFCIGTPIAGRGRVETEPLIGFFVNTLVLRSQLSAEATFLELLRQTRELTLESYAHQDVPFELLVEELNPSRSLSRTPLFQVVLDFHNTPAAALRLGDLSLARLYAPTGRAKFDLELDLGDRGEDLAGELEFSTDLFDGATIARLLSHLVTLLSAATADPEQRIAEIPLLGAAERWQLLGELNATEQEFPRDCGLAELFERQVRHRPEAVAVSFGAERLSYAELDARANRLARWLRRHGVGQDVLVALLVERSLEMIVAILGILKAGGAYAPIEPGMPPLRLRFLLADLRSPALLTQSSLLEEVAAAGGFAGPVLHLDVEDLSTEPSTPPMGVTTDPLQLAYINYTSGSTGAPKGVVVPHLGVTRLVMSPDYITFDEQDRVLQLSTYAWDAATFEIWGALLNGGRLVLIERATVVDLPALSRRIADEGITVLYLTTALFNQVIEQAWEGLRGLKTLIVGGETASVPHFRRAVERLPGTRLINEYGPTENTSFSSWHLVSEAPSASSLPIGRPLSSSTVYVLDGSLMPVTMGGVGELMLGGDGLARGYWNRPDLTAERFVPHPFLAGERLYRTGDLGSFSPTGTLEFLGRRDLQVKIRGHRVELAEVEEALRQHGEVRDAAVLLEPRGPQDGQLVAYVAINAAQLDVRGLRDFLKQQLPEYMVPSAFVPLAALPLTTTGKVDRRALAQFERRLVEVAGDPPRTMTEELLAAIWKQLLRGERVSRQDSFFDLGGHSLLATQVLSRMREAFGVELPLRALFEEPTLERLARRVDEVLAGGRGRPAAPPIVPVARDRELPLSFAQQRLWFLDQLTPGSPVYNVPVAVRLAEALEVPALALTLSELVCRHEVLRCRFPRHQGRPALAIDPPRPVPLPVIDLGALPSPVREGEARQLARREARRPFSLQGGAPLRATLLRLALRDHIVLLTLHHIACDGWSMGLLVEEITAIYAAFSAGEPSPLPALPIQYADFAAWQRGWLQGQVLDAELAHWRARLAGAPPLLNLPTDRPWPATQRFRGASLAFRLETTVVRRLRALTREAEATLFMTLMAAFQALLSRYTQSLDISLGTTIAGRNRLETERLIGFFVNTLVLRTDLTGDPAFRDLLSRVREVALDAHAYQDLPFEKLVEELQPERHLGHTPLFQVMLNLQHAPLQTGPRPGLRLVPFAVAGETTKFSLTLALTETQEEIGGTLEYDTDLFDPATAMRLLGSFETLLAQLAGDPLRRLSALGLLAPAQRHQLLSEESGAGIAPAPAACLHELFEARAAVSPEAIAVVSGDETLSYRELNRRANLLARRLLALGVGPEARIALCLERSCAMVVAIVGVLKAGGAYLPLDPASPPERLRTLLARAAAAALISDGSAGSFAGLSVPILELADGGAAEGDDGENPRAGARPDNAAYIIFTSGSTGAPKGVVITHASVARLFAVTEPLFGFTDRDVWTLFHSYAFDFSVWEIWGALLYGGRLVVVPYWTSRSPDLLDPLLREQEVTIFSQTPSALRALLTWEGDRPAPPSLRWVVLGGEAVEPRSLLPWVGHPGGSPRLANMYGITETTVHVTWYPLRAEDCREGGGCPLGSPLPGLRLYLLEPGLEPAPLGVAGEICVGGAGLARGYLGQPDLTAERFLPDPFAAEPGGRLYRSGDLAVRRADGALTYLGRADHQLKIRGFRIEPAEIETALAGHPGVRQCVVLARDDRPGELRLVAYLVGVHDHPLPADELRQFLRRRLPEPLIPASFVQLSELPRTVNGKIDRRALPAPDSSRPALDLPFIGARTPTEQTLAAIWSEVLRIEQPGVGDSFFVLGGHSLLAIQVVSRVRDVFGVELPLRQIFETPTISELAAMIDREGGGEVTEVLELIDQLSDDEVAALLAHPLRQGALETE